MVSADRRNRSAIRSIRDLLQYRTRIVSPFPPLIRFVEMSRLLKQAEFEDLVDRFRETLVIASVFSDRDIRKVALQ